MSKKVSVGDAVTIDTLDGEVNALVTSVIELDNGEVRIGAVWTSADPTNNDPYGRALVRASGYLYYKTGDN